ncbi:hypothetical protein CVT25_000990 [Psilocybe cyanescens]|uniref:Uncharacterized protein n=1 Tax=Psilocybe cyanescens TaxID=93625 RepID=A0A409XMK4_PSICY|nr:hypothetical protein CVT25_000990 [Psilocybe cyanescens]
MRRSPPYVQYEGTLDCSLLDDDHVEVNPQLPTLPPAVKSMLTKDLPPADPDTDYMDHLPPITAGGPLSPLSFFQDWQSIPLSEDPLHHEIYISSMQLPRKLGQKERGASMRSDDDETSPERCPYPSLLDIGHEWVTSPESVDTDLDDESVLSSSTSSLSPPYPDSDLRQFTDSEEYLDDVDDDLYFPHASPSSTQSPVTDLYHPLEQYPSHYEHLYNPIITSPHEPPQSPPSAPQIGDPPPPSPLSLCPSFSMIDHFSAELFSTPSERGGGASTSSTAHPRSFSSFYELDDALLPCSPSRRRSKELPTLDDDSSGLQCPGSFTATSHPSAPAADTSTPSAASAEPSPQGVPPQRTQWLSLPGAETDDDLIPRELASKNYVPDPTITVPSSQPRGSLLIWGPTSSRLGLGLNGSFASDLFPPAPRSPSPENLDLDPATLAELAPEGQSEEAQKLYEMRLKTAKSESWERERCRELSALLRLKLRLDEKKHEPDYGRVHQVSLQQPSVDADAATAPLPGRSASFPCPSSTSTSVSPSCALSSPSPQRSPPRRSSSSLSSKAKITSMAQLVANMVFHRQQESPKRNSHHAAARSSRTGSLPTAAAAAQFGSGASPTPRSPLRQVTLPQSDDDVLEEEDQDQCLSPLTPFGFCESPLSYSYLTELEPLPLPIQTCGKEHDQT